jgi:hypothetical protein
MTLAFLAIGSICYSMENIAQAAQDKAQEKISAGVVEDVIFLPWGVKLPARIDTGAAMTSLHAQDLVVKDGIAEFLMPDGKDGVKVRLPVVRWKVVHSAGGIQRRPVVKMEMCMGPKKLLTRVNLANRAHMKYPVIVGRNVLKRGFTVDSQRSYILEPNCLEVQSK